MRAAVLEQIGKIRVKEVDRPACPPGGMLLAVEACAICGSDVRTYRHGKYNVHPPAILGHELVGVIAESRSETSPLQVGQRVAVKPNFSCGACSECLSGHEVHCPKIKVIGLDLAGGFAEYVALPAEAVEHGALIPLRDDTPSEHACLMEPLACVINAHEQVQTSPGDVVVILGAGPLGYMHLAVARLRGATRTVTVDVEPNRLAMTQSLRPDFAINSLETDVAAEVMSLTDHRGADVVVVATSAPAAYQQITALCAPRARISLFGGLPKSHPEVPIDLNAVHYGALVLFGSFGSNLPQNRTALALIENGQVPIQELVSRDLDLGQIVPAIELIERGEVLRVVLRPNGRYR